jgi:hypothetical protein
MSTAVLGGCAILGLSLIAAKNPINTLIYQIITSTYAEGKNIFERSIYDSSVIALSGLVSFGINLALDKHAKNLSPAQGIEGSYKVAYFVAVAFFLKTALNPLLERAIAKNRESNIGTKEISRIQNTVVRYLVPLTISTIAARSYGLEVKTLPAVGLTVSIFYGMKLLGAGYRRVLCNEQVNNLLIKVYDILNPPKAETPPKKEG